MILCMSDDSLRYNAENRHTSSFISDALLPILERPFVAIVLSADVSWTKELLH